jgi:hypothetical protein
MFAPAVARRPVAYTVTPGREGDVLQVATRRPFQVAAADAMGIDRTAARSTPAWTRSPPSASSGTTATTPWRSRPGWSVAYERNTETNVRLEDAWTSRSCASPAASSAAAGADRAA